MMMMMHVISVYFMFYMQFSPIGLLTYSSTKEKCEKWQFNKCENQTEQWLFSLLYGERKKRKMKKNCEKRERERLEYQLFARFIQRQMKERIRYNAIELA